MDKKKKKKLNYLEKALTVDPQTCKPKYDLERWTQIRHYPAGHDIETQFERDGKKFKDELDGREFYNLDKDSKPKKGSIGADGKPTDIAWAKEFDYMELDADATEKEKMQIMVTSNKKDTFGEYIMCNGDKNDKENYSIRVMIQ